MVKAWWKLTDPAWQLGANVGKTLGPWRLERFLGTDLLGERYRASPTQAGEHDQVELRLFYPGLIEADTWASITRDLETLSTLDSLHIIRPLAFDMVEGFHVAAFTWVEGRSLRDILYERGPLPLDEALTLARLTLAAIQALHQVGLMHAMVRPDCIFIERTHQGHRTLRLADAGLWPLIACDDPIALAREHPEALAPLASYTPPELARGYAPKRASDTYLVATLLYELLTGRPPFPAQAPDVTLQRQQGESPLPLHLANANVTPPEALQAILDRALKKSARKRFRSTDALLKALIALSPPQARENEGFLPDDVLPLPTPVPDAGDMSKKRKRKNSKKRSSKKTEKPSPPVEETTVVEEEGSREDETSTDDAETQLDEVSAADGDTVADADSEATNEDDADKDPDEVSDELDEDDEDDDAEEEADASDDDAEEEADAEDVDEEEDTEDVQDADEADSEDEDSTEDVEDTEEADSEDEDSEEDEDSTEDSTEDAEDTEEAEADDEDEEESADSDAEDTEGDAIDDALGFFEEAFSDQWYAEDGADESDPRVSQAYLKALHIEAVAHERKDRKLTSLYITLAVAVFGIALVLWTQFDMDPLPDIEGGIEKAREKEQKRVNNMTTNRALVQKALDAGDLVEAQTQLPYFRAYATSGEYAPVLEAFLTQAQLQAKALQPPLFSDSDGDNKADAIEVLGALTYASSAQQRALLIDTGTLVLFNKIRTPAPAPEPQDPNAVPAPTPPAPEPEASPQDPNVAPTPPPESTASKARKARAARLYNRGLNTRARRVGRSDFLQRVEAWKRAGEVWGQLKKWAPDEARQAEFGQGFDTTAEQIQRIKLAVEGWRRDRPTHLINPWLPEKPTEDNTDPKKTRQLRDVPAPE